MWSFFSLKNTFFESRTPSTSTNAKKPPTSLLDDVVKKLLVLTSKIFHQQELVLKFPK